jgi:putative glutamine amidotransferase
MEPLKIGVSARLLYPDPTRTFLPGKSVQYLEQSVANWVMSGEVLAFMDPGDEPRSTASPHFPKALKVKNYVDALDGPASAGRRRHVHQELRRAPINPLWAGDEVRDAYEIELFHEFVTQGKPVFGICRGHQLINVALGGTLYQDIATQCDGQLLPPRRGQVRPRLPPMRILPGTWLSRLYPARTTTRVKHDPSPGPEDPRRGLVAEAMSDPDGIVEAIRWEGHSFVVGVQWHPEFMDPKDPA